jgi:hypothetical protein
MEQGQENLNPELPPQKSSENSPADDHAIFLEKNIPESKHETESENDNSINDSLDEKGKSTSWKGWFFILALLSILSAGTYFYFHKNKLNIFENLPWDVKKIFPEFANTTSPLDIEPKKLLIEPIESNTNQNEFDGSPESLITNKERKISSLQKEIQSLKFKQNNIPLLPDKITNQIQQPTDSSFDKKSEAINKIKENKPLLETKNILAPLLPIKVEPIDKDESEKQPTKENKPLPETKNILAPLLPIKVEPINKDESEKQPTKENKPLPETKNILAPLLPIKVEPIDKDESEKQPTKEVQAYLDFVEDTGSKLVELVKKGWAKLNQLILSNKQNT